MNKLFFFFGILFLSTTSMVAQDVTVDKILATYFENIGGEEAWKEVKSLHMVGNATAQGMEMKTNMYAMEPNLLKLEIDVQGMTMVAQAYDGEVAWMLNPFAGGEPTPQKMPEAETEELKKEKFQDAFIDYKAKGSTVELIGKKEVDGTETYEVKLTTKDGTEKFYYFESENFVPIMQKQVIQSGQMKGAEVETYMSDYQEIGETGLMTPYSIEQKVSGETVWQMAAEAITVNPESVSKETFVFPSK